MTTQMFRRVLQGSCSISMAVATLLFLIGFSAPTAAQSRESTDRDNPVRLTSGDFTSSVFPDRQIYYTFMANPGQLTVTLNVIREPTSSASVLIELFDNDANKLQFQSGNNILRRDADRLTGLNEQLIDRMQINRRQPLLMRITSGGVGTYRVRLSGAVDLARATPSPNMPPSTTVQGSSSRGVLRIEMNDGSVQEIDLSRVRQLTVRP